MLEPRPDWYSAEVNPLPAPTSDDIGLLSHTINSLKDYAQTLLDADAAAYRSIIATSSSHRFMSTIMTSGTMSDKVSALTLEVQEAPIHSSKAFENLMGLAAKRSRGQAIAALGALVDMLGNGVVLPSDRRLRTFYSQPGLLGALQAAGPKAVSWKPNQALPGALTKEHLMLWKFEDWLKDAFFQILQQLEVWCNDEIEYSRSRSLDFVFGLLRSKPEQEANLLRLLVNKLGDRERKIASRASYLLLQLLNSHPGMKSIVVQTIEQEILLRPGESLRAKYYAINTLNQTILSNKEPVVADTLVRVYFELFLVLLKSGALGSVDISSGQRDAFTGNGPNAKGKDAKGKRDKRGNRRGGDSNNKSGGSGDGDKNLGTERDVAEKLVSALLTGVNRAIPFSSADSTTLEQHMDTLFRITHSSNFNTSIQALMLVQQVAVTKQLAVDRFYRTLYESLLDPRLVTSSKQAMYLNLLYRSLKNDVDVRRVKAFVKRMLQVATLHQPPFICGILFMVAELESSFPTLKSLINDPVFDDEDEDEHYVDVPEEGEEQPAQSAAVPATASTAPKKPVYDGRKRDPEHSNAQHSCLWELMPFFTHFHPSVQAFATNLLVRQTSLPKPDMANHTLMHFLDKFVYRNPKALATPAGAAAADVNGKGVKLRGASIMQPMAEVSSMNGAAQIVVPGKVGVTAREAPINSAAFWNQKVGDVAAEDVFFHTYFAQVGKPAKTSRAAKRAAEQEAAATTAATKAGEDDGGEDEDEDEEEIWQALKASRREVAGDGESDEEGGDHGDDMDMDDFDDDDLSGLESLLNMSDSDEEGDGDGEDVGMDVEDDDESGGVEFADFGDEDEDEAVEDVAKAAPADGKKANARLRRKELKALPTFASADDYAEMLGAGDEDEDY